jgi:CheY-like chemotaxis protein
MTEPILRLLYVDDEPDIRELVGMSLDLDGGFEARICGSGAEALEVAPRFRPDLILLDVMMPGMDGRTTLRQLRAMPDLAAVPVIFFTAKVMPSEIARFRELGAAEVLSKPFDPLTLAEQIRAVWRRVG